jgi:Domain of unknown function (DUF1906)/Tachylectin
MSQHSRRSALRMLGAITIGPVAVAPLPGMASADVAAAAVRLGIDYSWGRPRPSAIVAAGYTFVCRYVSRDTTGKNLTRTEANALRAAGLDIVTNWEHSAREALDGYSAGATNAREADRQALACGMPASRPIYFSVDFDATSAQQSTINAYFDGVASVIGRARTGAYGGYGAINRLFNAGKITWGWQTYAWSGGRWDSRAHLRQVLNNITVDGEPADRNEAHAVDFGQWGGGPKGLASVYGVMPDGRLTYTIIDGATGRRTHGAVVSAATLGFTTKTLATLNFNTLLVTSTEGRLYRVDIRTNSSSLTFEPPVDLGGGWTHHLLTYDGGGHLWGIAGDNATLIRYTISGDRPTAANITGRTDIGRGFTQKTLTTSGPNWILGNHADGRLLAYRVTGPGDYQRYDLRPATWQVFDHILSPGGGVYLAHKPDGSMAYYLDPRPYDGNGADISSATTIDTSGWGQTLLSVQPQTVTNG